MRIILSREDIKKDANSILEMVQTALNKIFKHTETKSDRITITVADWDAQDARNLKSIKLQLNENNITYQVLN